jgi:hypothetical protein
MHIIFEINCTTVTRVGCRIMGGFQEILCWTTADIVRTAPDDVGGGPTELREKRVKRNVSQGRGALTLRMRY